MLYPSRKRTDNAWSSMSLARGSQTITDPASRWLGHDWPCTLQKQLNGQSELGLNQSLALHTRDILVGNWNTQGGFAALSNFSCLFSWACSSAVTNLCMAARKEKEDWFLKGNFFVFILSQLDKKLSSKWSAMFRGRSLSQPSSFGCGRVHRLAFIPLHFMNPAESLRHQPWPYQRRTALLRSLSIDW